MTQDLIIGVLVVGFVGLIWAMALAIMTGDRAIHDDQENRDAESPGHTDGAPLNRTVQPRLTSIAS